jgi:molecular chaperone GrpE
MSDDNDTRHDDADELAATDPDAVEPGERFDAVAALAELEAAMQAAEAAGRPEGGSDKYIEMLESEVLELNALLEKKDAAIAKAEARAERAQEEIEKAKARLAAESARQIEARTRKALVTMLEVLDELDRAVSAVGGAEHHPDLVAGVEGVHRLFVAKLESLGVRRCPALGAPFDPVLHEAVTLSPTTDPEQDGRVIAVLREGYTIGTGDELLRPAAVVVGKLG